MREQMPVPGTLQATIAPYGGCKQKLKRTSAYFSQVLLTLDASAKKQPVVRALDTCLDVILEGHGQIGRMHARRLCSIA